MINIKGNALITFTAAAGETYCIQYDSNYSVNIANLTDGDIYVSSDETFNEMDGAGNYLAILSGGGYNGYNHIHMYKNKLFIKTDEAGKVCVVIRR
ncbi:MAG: hypothetical protein Q4G33_09805 [bacterium]|nr:hypothetical protein [bacterium]